MWDVDYSYIEDWLDSLDRRTRINIFQMFEMLEMYGPALGRPFVDTIKSSNIKNLKELRPPSPGRTELRILFAFDFERKAIMLLGGDKSKGKRGKLRWNGWYKKAIPQAEQLFIQYLRRKES